MLFSLSAQSIDTVMSFCAFYTLTYVIWKTSHLCAIFLRFTRVASCVSSALHFLLSIPLVSFSSGTIANRRAILINNLCLPTYIYNYRGNRIYDEKRLYVKLNFEILSKHHQSRLFLPQKRYRTLLLFVSFKHFLTLLMKKFSKIQKYWNWLHSKHFSVQILFGNLLLSIER